MDSNDELSTTLWRTSTSSLSTIQSMLTSVAAHVGCLAVSADCRDSGREEAQAENEEQSRHHFQNHCSLVSGQDAIDDPLSALYYLDFT